MSTSREVRKKAGGRIGPRPTGNTADESSGEAGSGGHFPIFEPTAGNVTAVVCMVIAFALSVGASLAFGGLVDTITTSSDMSSAFQAIGILGALMLASTLANLFLARLPPLMLTLDKSIAASEEVIDEVLSASQRQFERHDTGYYLSLASVSAFTYGDVYGTMNVLFVGGAACLLLLLAVTLVLSAPMFFLFIAYVPACLALFHVPSERASSAQNEWLPRQDEWLDEGRRIIDYKRPINALRAEDFFEHRFAEATGCYTSFLKRFKFYDVLAQALPEGISPLLQVLTACVALVLLSDGELSVGSAMSAFALSALLKEPLTYLGMYKTYYVVNKPSLSRLSALARDAAAPSGYSHLGLLTLPKHSAAVSSTGNTLPPNSGVLC